MLLSWIDAYVTYVSAMPSIIPLHEFMSFNNDLDSTFLSGYLYVSGEVFVVKSCSAYIMAVGRK
jgi:hypothetical protein